MKIILFIVSIPFAYFAMIGLFVGFAYFPEFAWDSLSRLKKNFKKFL